MRWIEKYGVWVMIWNFVMQDVFIKGRVHHADNIMDSIFVTAIHRVCEKIGETNAL